MRRFEWIAAALGAILGAWMAFDGARALLTGDYRTPRGGEYAGQLGPWAGLLTALGIDPRSSAVKGAHVALGTFWIVAAVLLAVGASWARGVMLACAVATLWYLPAGTVIALAVMILRVARRSRSGASP